MSCETTNPTKLIHFRPSRVDGVADVEEVVISASDLTLICRDNSQRFVFLDFAKGREIASRRIPLGEINFSKAFYPDSHFVFYTTPRITIYMPTDGPTTYPQSHFWRVREILGDAGFKFYEDGPPKLAPYVLNPRPWRTIAYVAVILMLAWLFVLAGFLPEPIGGAWRHFLTSNPDNPAIGFRLILTEAAIPLILAFRHARRPRALLAIVAGSFVAAMGSEWMLRDIIRPWAPLDQPPFNSPFWSVSQFGKSLVFVSIAALLGWIWRRGCLEPISGRVRE